MLQFPDFEKGVQKKILDRGFEYYEYKNVEEVDDLGNGIFSAVVSGTDDYDVFIRIEDNHVAEQSCTCPYVEEYGDTCKHIVAVLYYIRDAEMYENRNTESLEKRLSKILKKVPTQELRDYVNEYALRNRQFREDLLRAFGR